ncbi:MAG TPA: hypothetical protein VI911_07220 [Patescibacteria group bacterium]|nr:hypothetical protein [Patescibacteria group bacterium]
MARVPTYPDIETARYADGQVFARWLLRSLRSGRIVARGSDREWWEDEARALDDARLMAEARAA